MQLPSPACSPAIDRCSTGSASRLSHRESTRPSATPRNTITGGVPTSRSSPRISAINGDSASAMMGLAFHPTCGRRHLACSRLCDPEMRLKVAAWAWRSSKSRCTSRAEKSASTARAQEDAQYVSRGRKTGQEVPDALGHVDRLQIDELVTLDFVGARIRRPNLSRTKPRGCWRSATPGVDRRHSFVGRFGTRPRPRTTAGQQSCKTRKLCRLSKRLQRSPNVTHLCSPKSDTRPVCADDCLSRLLPRSVTGVSPRRVVDTPAGTPRRQSTSRVASPLARRFRVHCCSHRLPRQPAETA